MGIYHLAVSALIEKELTNVFMIINDTVLKVSLSRTVPQDYHAAMRILT